MDDVYYSLINDVDSLKTAEEEINGMDDFLSDRIKVASMDDLFNFLRIGEDTLVHKSQKDLWRISEDKKGQMVIERLFDPNSKQPIRV